MIDLNLLEKLCPKCKGKGSIENDSWYHYWTKRNLKFQVLETKDKLSIINEAEDPPDEPVFFFCRDCHGRGKLLTAEGKRLMEFIRFWINPNY